MAQPGHIQGHNWQHESQILPDRVREKERQRPVSLRGDQIWPLYFICWHHRHTIRVLHTLKHTLAQHANRLFLTSENILHKRKLYHHTCKQTHTHLTHNHIKCLETWANVRFFYRYTHTNAAASPCALYPLWINTRLPTDLAMLHIRAGTRTPTRVHPHASYLNNPWHIHTCGKTLTHCFMTHLSS